ncbi:MAG: hypothetical protein IJA80_08770 [Clostridia bacterium]|nr:hypothetical protein [Clostridia bacterium]MBR2953943.1 hypothetical protein [Clostridia bacterium]
MNSAWIIFFVLFIVLLYQKQEEILVVVRKHLRKKRGKTDMTTLIERYIGKECLIYTCTSSSQITGTIKSCNEGWLEIENSNGQCDLINCEYIMRIREYPRNKKGKKKGVILD